jgi:hypothetical protein
MEMTRETRLLAGYLFDGCYTDEWLSEKVSKIVERSSSYDESRICVANWIKLLAKHLMPTHLLGGVYAELMDCAYDRIDWQQLASQALARYSMVDHGDCELIVTEEFTPTDWRTIG